MGQDPFTAAERDTQAMVSAGWWPSAPPQQRQHAIAGRMLVLPDGTWWLFGAWARWYRWHPSDGQWYLCPPPQVPVTRMSARPAQGAQVPALPPHVVPAGPDFAYDAPPARPFVGRGFSPELTARVRATVEQAAALPASDFPHWWSIFSSETPSTVAVAWGVMLWCAAAPVFDSQLDDQMLKLWSPYRAKPLPEADGPRWLTPPPLEALVGLYAERLRSSRVDSAVSVLRTMWAVASALRDDERFRARADALLAILGATLNNPTVDYGALPYGDQALVQQWLTRCPPHLAPALRNESSPGDNVRHAYYDLSEAIAEVAGDPADPSYLEPRLVAAALIAADLAKVRQDVAGKIVPWLDPEIRYTVQAVHGQVGHPLRRLWPDELRLPDQLRANLGVDDGAEILLGASYIIDLAWCRLAGIPARPRGFPVPTAILAEIIGPQRAKAAAAPSTPAPAASPVPGQGYPGQAGGAQPPGWPGSEGGGQAWPGQSQSPGVPGAFGVPGVSDQPAGSPYDQQGGYGAPAQQPDPSAQPGAYNQPGEYNQPGAYGQPGAPGQPGAYGQPDSPDQPGGFNQPGVPGQPGGFGGPGVSGQPDSPGGFNQPGVPGQPGGFDQSGVPGEPGAYGQPGVPGQPDAYGAPGQPGGPGQQGGFGQQEPGQPYMQAPAQPPVQPGQGSDEEAEQQENWAPPYTQLGFQRAGGQPLSQPPSPYEQANQAGQWDQPEPWNGQQGGAEQQPAAAHWSPEPGQADPLSTRVDGGPAAPSAPAGPPRTRILGPGGEEAPERGEPPQRGVPVPPRPASPASGPGTRVMSETMIGDFDFIDEAPLPARPVHEIAPPPDQADRRVFERYGIRFVSGEQDVAELLDELRDHPAWAMAGAEDFEATRVDGRPGAGSPPSVLLVGSPHTGQRRLARLIAVTLAEAGIGDGAIRTADAQDVRGASAEQMAAALEPGGPTLLFERLDAAILEAMDPAAMAKTVRSVRARPGQTTLIATCEPRHFKRLSQDHPKLIEVFRVFRLPDLTRLGNRMTLLHLLADERRVTVGADALAVAEEDLDRLRGPGDLVNARLVEAYLDQAFQRHIGRVGAARDRPALTPEDFAGVAEAIEPALRPAGDIDGYLGQLDRLLGLEEVKQIVEDLIAEARLAVERARHGVYSGGPSRHLIFLGPPGVGKTTVAGLLGGIYAALGLLDSGHVVACRPVHLAGRDDVDTETRVTSMVEQAMGGVLLIQEAYRLDRSPAVVRELLRHVDERRDKFMVVCTSPGAEMEGFLAGNPGFRSEFGAIIEFEGLSDRRLVQLFNGYAERDLYLLDEELRVELLARFARMREDAEFGYARTARAMFEQTVARQAARLAGADVNAATVARLTVRDLPESALEQMLGQFHQDQGG